MRERRDGTQGGGGRKTRKGTAPGVSPTRAVLEDELLKMNDGPGGRSEVVTGRRRQRRDCMCRCALCDTMALTSVSLSLPASLHPFRSVDLLLRRAPFPDISAVKLSAPRPSVDLMRTGGKKKKLN